MNKQTVLVLLPVCLLLLAIAEADDKPKQPRETDFPTRGLLPKEEIGALRLLEQHPDYDGRGVVVAVFDTGVDPGAAGLSTTSDGQPKILDVIDATGSGDVNTSRTVEVDKNQDTVEGLTGRTLTLDKAWLKTDRHVHLGVKHAFDFFPGYLQARLKRERREDFDRAQNEAEAALRRQIAAWDEEHSKPTAEERAFRKELDVRLKQLLAAGKSAKDPGPMYDCLVYRDGETWRAVVDTDEDGDLTDEKTLTDYHVDREYATFGGGAEMNFAVNIYDDGDTLSIVADCGAHATHVAGIIAGYFPERPERNGIAPGAQIVSIKIGDARLASMETGKALVRGLSAAALRNCDLINMSYGEPTTLANRGRILELITEAVDRHGVMFVAAAGNNGPGLGTVIAPGGVTEAVMGVGAYVSPAMMQVEYTLRSDLPEMPFSWSSRGPAADGAFGVDVFAPGAAIAPVPNWTLNRSMQMNGTSMASPNACGASALLLSGLKAEGKPYTPYSIRRALQNTARPIEDADALTQGAGLIQVDEALSYLLEHAEHQSPALLRYDVSVRGGETQRGILLREPHQLGEATRHSVRIRPVFREDAPPADKRDFERRITLEATQPWVHVGRHLLLASMGRSFELEVDPTGLEPGVHLAEIHGVDADHPEAGPLFHLPVVVAMTVSAEHVGSAASPTEDANVYRETLEFQPGKVVRRFLTVPSGATWADVRLRAVGGEDEREFVIHTDQPQTGQAFVEGLSRRHVTLGRGRDVVRSFAVRGGCSLELCVAQYWSSLGDTEVELELNYHGLAPDRQSITLLPGEPSTEVEVTATLQRATLAPRARLTTLRQMLRPTSATIRPLLSPRERLFTGDLEYELVLEYAFEQSEPGSVTLRLPLNDELFYESPLGEQLWMLFDAGKQLIAVDDWRPGAVSVGRGEHVVRVQLRDSNLARLEAAKSAILWLDRPLKSPLSLSVHSSRADALAAASPLTRRNLEQGEHVELHLAAPAAGRIPTHAQGGDVLLGTITYGESDASTAGAGRRPGGYEVRLVVPPKKSSNPSPAVAKSEEGFEKELLELRIEQLRRLDENQAESFEELATQLLREHPGNLDVLTARLHRLDHVAYRKTRLPEVIKAADAVIAQIDTEALARHFGTSIDPQDKQAAALRRRMEVQKKILIDTLYRKGRAIGYMELPDVIDKHPIEDPQAHDKAFEENFAELQKWVDTTGEDYFLLHLRRDRRKQRYGQALELLNRHIPRSAPNYWHYKKRRDLYEKLGWPHLHAWEAVRLLKRFPKEYAPF